jgi:hypothetical protein
MKLKAIKKTGRPSSFTQDKADLICDLLARGKSLRHICSLEQMPDQTTVMRWLATNDTFRQQYARARELQAEFYADEIVVIADDASNDVSGELGLPNGVAVQRARLQIDTRKWIASKLLPKKYGDKVEMEHTGGVTLVHSIPRPNRISDTN